MYKIYFSDEDIKKCSDFSENVDTSFYVKRNQCNNNKRKLDSKIGKLGEIAVYKFLQNRYDDITNPDFKIYKPREKSWDFDLKSSKFNLHVKTQNIEQSKKFGESWIFQYGNGKNFGYDKEIFDRISPNQYVAFVIVSLSLNEAEIKSIVSLDLLHNEKLFKLPVLDILKKYNKLAVYFNDIKKCEDNLFQL